jgi:hypothetical protein
MAFGDRLGREQIFTHCLDGVVPGKSLPKETRSEPICEEVLRSVIVLMASCLAKNLQKTLKRTELHRRVVQNSRIGLAQKAPAGSSGPDPWRC